MTRDDYKTYIYTNNVSGSNKASSYLKALDLLSQMLEVAPLGFDDCQDIWSIKSVERLQELYLVANTEKHKGESSVWNTPNIPKSYLQNGYCTAALKTLQEFLVQHSYEDDLLNTFSNHSGSEEELPTKLDKALAYPKILLEGFEKAEGKEVVREVQVRSNQNVFRKMILTIYDQSCCITGLNIPQVNRASHIIPWAKDKTTRLDPRNGLCLSATYDAAFDRNLISLDDDYRIILSKELKEHYTHQSVQDNFQSKEGQQITLPISYHPNKTYLRTHRSQGDF